MEDEKSPAVKALGSQRAPQRSLDPLDEGLENTFPASDPVSTTTTVNANGSPRSIVSSDAPRVDEALESILEHRNDPYVEPREQLAALRDEAESLQQRAADDVRARIRRHPWQAIGLAAVAGFLFGFTR